MIPLNVFPTEFPVGLTTGKYPPYAILSDTKLKDLEMWSDGTSGTHGVFAPTNYASTEQTLITNNNTALAAIFSTDDNSYTSAGTKKKILGNYFNTYRSISKASIYSDELFATTTTLASSTTDHQDILEIGTDKILVVFADSADSNKLKGYICTLSGKSTVTAGTVFTIDTTATCIYPRIAKLADDKFVVAWGVGNTIKTAVATVSGTTPTFGATANATTNSSEFNGICKLDTDKFALTFVDNTSNKINGIAATVATTTITYGSAVQIYGGDADPAYGGSSDATTRGRNCTIQLGTDKMFTIWGQATGTTTRHAVCTFSGTVLTAGTSNTIANADINYNQPLEAVKVDTDKVMVIGGTSTAVNAVVITVSGTTTTVGTTKAITSASTLVSRHMIVKSSSEVLVMVNALISGSYVTYANILRVSGSTITTTDSVSPTVGGGTLPTGGCFLQTTNYTVGFGRRSTGTVSVAAIRHLSVTIAVNGSTAITGTTVPFFDFVSINKEAVGRKLYMSVTNANAFTQNIVFSKLYANVE